MLEINTVREDLKDVISGQKLKELYFLYQKKKKCNLGCNQDVIFLSVIYALYFYIAFLYVFTICIVKESSELLSALRIEVAL